LVLTIGSFRRFSDVEENSISNVEVYIGSLIEHGSDRAVLEHVVRFLSDANQRAIILCNVELGGCQIDLVVALEQLTLVVEAKSYRNAVRGDVNGPRLCLGRSGPRQSSRRPC
jgi:hypothetical protein